MYVVLKVRPVEGEAVQLPSRGSLLTNISMDDKPVAIPLDGVIDVSVNSIFHSKTVGLFMNILGWIDSS